MEHSSFVQPSNLYEWHIACEHIDDKVLDALSDHDAVFSVTASVLDGKNIAVFYAGLSQQSGEVQAHIATASLASDQQLAIVSCSQLVMRDWVAESQAGFAPTYLGRFVILGSHHDIVLAQRGHIPIYLDAGAAFGTGEHDTTSGCLQALGRIARHTCFRKVLDMGCGTAILAMGAARLHPCKVLAVDNDKVAVQVAGNNVARNHVQGQVSTLHSQGFRNPAISGNYDVIIANILARPVRAMAGDIAAALAPGGHAILSGFYYHDMRAVLHAYQQRGLVLQHVIRHKSGWTIVTLRRGRC